MRERACCVCVHACVCKLVCMLVCVCVLIGFLYADKLYRKAGHGLSISKNCQLLKDKKEKLGKTLKITAGRHGLELSKTSLLKRSIFEFK